MQLKLFKTLWGNRLPIESVIKKALNQGFDGLEGQAPQSKGEASRWHGILHDAKLDYIAEVVTGGDYVPNASASPQNHLEDLRQGIERSLELNPLFITCITGYDAWPEPESIAYFEAAMKLAQEYDVSVCFETHRSRSLFNPWVTQRITEALPEMRLTLDISHWCAVCERLMDSEEGVIRRFLPQVAHIHGRVGYDQGPQVPHPAAPEYESALKSHQTFWEQVWHHHRSSGLALTTLTPEFGPDGYLHTLPFTQMPVADLDEVNHWMAGCERQHFERFCHCL
ncbi:sugar phosphate isomerase/epimerase [Thiomicrorhabdus sp. zzn3]|uniref:sugar phosphate isomerase/epimerase family protein n=1 Tax=Thiomicrorhabdus sp. zzn3 TaxID=3039775 RepID=UPI002436654F|nr:TIM barrel protein [Thiomicrorhabdus sp. zzn3]MDG6777310.1 sugar phosphate isomerase/epimerase [Thiomicrorhabdus sp. zzn3]